MMIVDSIDQFAEDFPSVEFVILAPNKTPVSTPYRNIRVQHCGRFTGHLWEQVELPWFSRDGKLLNLCNSGPILHRDQLVVIHDALVYRMPENFSASYQKFHRFLGRQLVRRARIATVSDFSRRELSAVLGIPAESIVRISNGSDHSARIALDRSILKRLDLEGRRYFVFVGSPARNKNLAMLVAAFEKIDCGDVQLVTVGGLAKTFSNGSLLAYGGNILQAGRISDQELHALYGSAVALVFPSTYEGFGIPLLEAMSVGCPVLTSDIPVTHEVCGEAALFFDPMDADAIAAAMRSALSPSFDREKAIQLGRERARQFSWAASARTLVTSLMG